MQAVAGINTRFNPTTNGPLHVGHIYMALLNEFMAHDSGGEFLVRFDDNSRHHMSAHGGRESMRRYADAQLHDLEWMGIQIDGVSYQSEAEARVKQFLAQSRFQMVIDHYADYMLGNIAERETAPIIRIAGPSIYPMVMPAWIVAEKVVLDYWEGIDVLIRGPELLQENSLYVYLCALFGFRFPKCYYLPRLVAALGGDLTQDVSKARSNWKVEDLRGSGTTPEQVHELLRESCLVDPLGAWNIDNVKNCPTITVESL